MVLQASDLKKYSYFSTLSDGSLAVLCRKLTLVTYPAGTEIIEEGRTGDFFYFVKEGRLEMTKRSKSGQEAKLSVVGSGHGFGEMALLTCSIRACSVHAVTAVVLYRLAKRDFENIVLHEAAFKSMLVRKAQDFSTITG